MHAWQEFGLLGEHTALRFVNTVDDPGKTRDRSGVPDWPTLLAWAETAELIDAREHAQLAAGADPRTAADEVAAVHALREATWALLHQQIHADAPSDPPGDLAEQLRWALAGARLDRSADVWVWHADRAAFGAAVVRARLALAVEDFLRHPDLARLRACGRCAALFLDHGRGRGRRWCRMETCGNRAKAARHRARS
jgi:predicted RNA-binding Zn ribbon-like protein